VGNKRKNYNKTYAIAIGSGITIILAVILFANYDVTVANQKIDPVASAKIAEQKFDELYKTIPIDTMKSSMQEFSKQIPIKIEPKSEKLEDKLLDCSKYKKDYLDANKNVRTTEDNMAAMMGDALTAVQQTRACEDYNNKVLTESGVLGHCEMPPLTMNMKEDANLSYKDRYIKYCGQEEWDYINQK